MDRALGNPLGNPLGLARKVAVKPSARWPEVFDITSGSGVFEVPAGYSALKVIAIGGGATGNMRNGGGGGGSAVQLITLQGKAFAITYQIGAGGGREVDPALCAGGDTTAEFLGFKLVGGGGKVLYGGVGVGGSTNFKGGNGQAGSTYNAGAGGGAGGMYGDGANAGVVATANSLAGSGGALASGGVSGGASAGGGGGGFMGAGGANSNSASIVNPGAVPINEFTISGSDGLRGQNNVQNRQTGGNYGGGGTGYAVFTDDPSRAGAGGPGLLRILLW